MADPLPEISVDFNATDEEGLRYGLLKYATASLSEGDDVIATDEEGHECRARVVRIEGNLAYLDLDWPSWRVDNTQSPTTSWTEVTGNGNTETRSTSGARGELISA